MAYVELPEFVSLEEAASEETPDILDARIDLKCALSKLSSDARELIIGHHVHGMSADEIADERGVSTNSIEKRLQRAREALRRLMPGYL